MSDDPLRYNGDVLGNIDLESVPDALLEFSLWCAHPASHASTADRNEIQANKASNFPSLDVGDRLLKKDIGNTEIINPSNGAELESVKQQELRKVADVIGFDSTTEYKLEFAPRWLIDATIQEEKKNYADQNAYESVFSRSIPPNSNIISSHHFFKLGHKGKVGNLLLRCQLVPHGNRDAEKDSIRSDSSTAQLLCIRVILALATLFQFFLSTVDISAAYLQSGERKRDIYMRPPMSWRTHIDELWKLLKPAYGLVEGGRLWQLRIEEWLLDYGFSSIPGLPQFFILRRDGNTCLLLAKVVDDILIAGTKDKSEIFYTRLKDEFKVGSHVTDGVMKFNGLNMRQNSNFNIFVDMRDFLSSILPIPLSRIRRKSASTKCTSEETK